jgi:phospholipid/cholesterol/gamma-HCH transport system permease protein
MIKIVQKLGQRAVSYIDYVGMVAKLFFRTLYWIFVPPFKRERIYRQARAIGVDSLPIVSLVALFIGIILALQTAYQMQRLSSEIYIANIIALSIVRELGPVITSLIVAGRCGAAVTAELGTMKVTEQIDALETLATSPVKYLVVPRFLAFTFMLPVLTLYANIVGIFGGYLICVYRLGISSGVYLRMTFDSLQVKDLGTGLIKTLFFGMIIAMVSCLEGMRTKGGAEGVGKGTTISVVTSFILILAADCIFTAIFYFIFP